MENKIVKNRMIEQDIAKGIVMFCVVFLHSLTLYADGGRNYSANTMSWIMTSLFGYVMPFFMVIAGYNYKDKGESIFKKILKRAKQILIPLFYFSIVTWVIMGTYMIVRGETTISHLFNSFLGFWVTDPLAALLGLDASKTFVGQALGPAWFLKSLFTGQIIFYLVAPVACKSKKKLVISIVLLLAITTLFSYLHITLPWMLDAAPEMAALMLIGTLMKEIDIFNTPKIKLGHKIISIIIILVLSFTLQRFFYTAGTISAGRIDSVLGPIEIPVTAIYGFLGTYMLITISQWLAKDNFLTMACIWFGQNTLTTLLIHGSVLRVFCDIFNITNQPAVFTIRNVYAFICSFIVIVLILKLLEFIKLKTKQEKK